MLIDWFTVVAQVINFLILVWLLKRFLYRPILDAIDAREKRIAAELAEAEAKKNDAMKERDEFLHKNEELDKQRSVLMNQMMDEVKTEHLRLLDMARQESDDLRVKLQEELRREQNSMSEELSRRTREEVFAIARKTLSDLAGATLEERMTEIFLQRLRELNDAEMMGLKSAFKVSSQPLIVRTAFILPVEQRHVIETAIKEILGEEKNVKFETAPDLVSGIEIRTNGQKIAWSIADYLVSMAMSVDSLLRTPTQIQSKAEIINQLKTEQGPFENGA